MRAAVVTEFGSSPAYAESAEPVAGPGEEILEVVAAALHPRVRSQAAGSHYTSTDELPLIPGVDGVGRRSDGSLAYFVLGDGPLGSMAERVAVDTRRMVPLPAGVDPVAIAAAMNPAMSSWLALRRRAHLEPGQSVLILGATGSAGQLAVQIAKHLGAAHVVAAGRDQQTLDSLEALGADELVSLAGDSDDAAERVGRAAADVDVAVDYLWGRPAERTIPALLAARADPGRRLDWVQVGAITGPELTIASALLRGANLALMGSGQGSVSTREIVQELVPLAAEVTAGTFTLNTEVRALADVESVWTEPSNPRRRLVFTLT
jgi:NADPH:quinone reductase-like Zn-dependent oxidoreductase